jgi:hypothetical protein
MKSLLVCTVLLLAGFVGPQTLRAQTAAMPDDKAGQPKKRGGIFTMYALDPLARTLCFNDGKEGMQFLNNGWENRCSDLSFSLAGNGSLITGFEVNRIAAIVDLGTANDLRGRYGFEDADNGGVGFASLRLQGNKVMVLQEDNTKPVWQTLEEGAKLFGELGPSANAPIKLGHIYVLRIADTKDKGFQQVVKLMVIAYRPDEAVTLRWELMQ